MINKQIVLIVDDTPENLQVLGSLLEEEYDVRIATSGATALESIKVSIPDLVLLDIMMPEMSGFELCRILKSDDNLRPIPIIFISALGMSEKKIEAFREGAVDYITKPFYADEVLARVRTHLRLSKMEELTHEIAQRRLAEEKLIKQNILLESQYEQYKQLNEKLLGTITELEIAKTQAQESDRLKTAFLQNISHEVRTPLNAIVGFSSLLQKENLNEKSQAFTKIINKSCDRLLETVGNILDIATIEAGQIKLRLSSVSLNSLIAELHELFLPKAIEKGITLSFCNGVNDQNFTITADERRLHQVLNNLLLNSIKFTSQGTIDFGYTLANNTLVFHVKDTGVGIAENCKESIFERFVQGDTSISRGYEGAGLGLSICKGLVLLMGGSIWVESKENEGATFYFTLPLPYTTYTSEAVEQPSAEVVVKGNILIAEDDEFSFEYLKELLEGTSCRLLRAENGAKVLEMATNIPGIDLILMDIKMPVMDGLVATKRIKALKPHIPIIAQSAFVFDSERQMMLDAGCDDYLSKPIKREELMNIMQKYMCDK